MPHVVLEFDYIAAEQLGRVRGIMLQGMRMRLIQGNARQMQ